MMEYDELELEKLGDEKSHLFAGGVRQRSDIQFYLGDDILPRCLTCSAIGR